MVICTRNRSELFAQTCEALLATGDRRTGWELIVVDNASTDDTVERARALQRSSPRPMAVVREATVGLSAARNAGVLHARGQIIAFLDDDALPSGSWLTALLQVLQEDRVYAAGGPVEPRFTSRPPAWFSDRFLPYLTVWDLGPEPLYLTYNEYPRGANMAFRREAFDRFGLFSPHLGRKARSLLSCEEIELCLRIERGGGLIAYAPRARVAHLVDGKRVTRRWLEQRFRAQGASEAIVDWRHAGLAGLACGLRRAVERAVRSRRGLDESERLVRRCELAAAGGYLRGVATAPLTIPRYRPRPEAGPAAPWRPSSAG